MPRNVLKLYFESIYGETFMDSINKLYKEHLKQKLHLCDENKVAEACCICYEASTNITDCCHYYCNSCLKKIDTCAMCRKQL